MNTCQETSSKLTERQDLQCGAKEGITPEALPRHPLFKPSTFQEGVESVVGNCNGFTRDERWAKETPLFTQAILRRLPLRAATLLDYGCGVGRLAKEILLQNSSVRVIGVDDSEEELALARRYVDDERFLAMKPHDLNERVDLAFCIYVLQHVPAVEIREILQRIHYFLKSDAPFVYCSSEYRMAVRFDAPTFEDDRRLGVDLRRELARYFIQKDPLFDDEVFDENPIIMKIVTGAENGLPHPAHVYRKRFQSVPLFNYR